jgi:hypothetical protein
VNRETKNNFQNILGGKNILDPILYVAMMVLIVGANLPN